MNILEINNFLSLEEMIEEIASGKKEVLEFLYDKTHKDVFRFAFSILKNIHDAEDVMQDTYVNIHQYAHLYNSQNKPLAWIFTITKNLSYEKLKKQKRSINTDINDIEKLLHDKSEHHYNQVLIKTILENLSDDERKILVLNTSGFKHREIAQLLDLKLPTVLSKYHRAIKKIRESWKEV